MNTDEEMVNCWYGDIPYENYQQLLLMPVTGHLFEVCKDEAIKAENALKDIQKKFPPHIFYIDKVITNKALLAKL